jgi:hypothetical protein
MFHEPTVQSIGSCHSFRMQDWCRNWYLKELAYVELDLHLAVPTIHLSRNTLQTPKSTHQGIRQTILEVWNHLFKPLFKMNKIFKESWIKIINHHQFWICVSSIPITCCHPELDPRLTQCQLTMLKVVLSIVICSNKRPSRFAYLAWGNDWNHHQD